MTRFHPFPPTGAALLAFAITLASCERPPSQPPADEHQTQPSNRIDVPDMVRRNLGITYVGVQRRKIAATVRLPARVELLPAATRDYHAPFDGRLRLAVAPLQRVAAGDLLFTLASPGFHDRQRELAGLQSSIDITATRLASMQPLLVACEQHEQNLKEAHRVTADYVANLQQADQSVGGQAQKLAAARVELARFAADIADASEKHTTTVTRTEELRTQLASERRQLQLLLATTAAALGVDAAFLTEPVDGQPRWQRLRDIEVRASRAGIVDRIVGNDGSLLTGHAHVLTTVDPTRVRCRARALQSDLPHLRDGLSAAIVPATAAATTAAVPATLLLGPTGDATERTFDVFADPTADDLGFVRPGLAVFVEITTATTATDELAIPKRCVLRDGIDRVFFRRDPKNKDRVIRVVADLGDDDGRWVTVKSGIKDGDEVVADGAFELVLASSGQTPKGGHFHADGTWHEDH